MIAWGLDLSKRPSQMIAESFVKGLPYALLVVSLGVLYFVQQKMVAARAQVAPNMSETQAKMMQYLPVVFAFFLVFYLTGLVIYYMAQAIFRIGLQYYITHRFYKGEHSLGRQAQRPVTGPRDRQERRQWWRTVRPGQAADLRCQATGQAGCWYEARGQRQAPDGHKRVHLPRRTADLVDAQPSVLPQRQSGAPERFPPEEEVGTTNMEWVEFTARTLEEAKDLALDRLGVAADDAEFEVLSEPKPGLFGRLRGEARVRARVRPAQARQKVRPPRAPAAQDRQR
jgi:hypothetical protein